MMNSLGRTFYGFLIGCSLLCTLTVHAQESGLDALVARFPAQNAAERNELCAQVLALGPEALQQLCGRLVPMGEGDDAKVRYAVNGLAAYVNRPDAGAERAAYREALVASLAAAIHAEVKAFLISQLQWVVDESLVDVLRPYLDDETLCDAAARALVSLHSEKAGSALLAVLPHAEGTRRITLVKSLGDLHYKPAAQALNKLAGEDEITLRRIVLYAVANIADRSSTEILVRAAEATDPVEREAGTGYILLFAKRLAEDGQAMSAASICRKVIKANGQPDRVSLRCAALSTLVGAIGQYALNDLLQAAESSDAEYRDTALDLVKTLPGVLMTKVWSAALQTASATVRRGIITMLSERGDTAALDAVKAAWLDADKDVRLAAVEAAIRLGGSEALPALLEAMKATEETEVIRAIQEAALRLPSEPMESMIVAAMPTVSPVLRVGLIGVLSRRHAKNYSGTLMELTRCNDLDIRLAAIQALANAGQESDLPALVDLHLHASTESERAEAGDAVVAVAGEVESATRGSEVVIAALDGAGENQKTELLRTLGRISSADGLEAVVNEAQSESDRVRQAAIEALSSWKNQAGADTLLRLLQHALSATDAYQALQAYLHWIEQSGESLESRIAFYQNALPILDALHQEEMMALVLEGLGGIPQQAAFDAVKLFLQNLSLREAAARAIVHIVCPQSGNVDGIRSPAIYQALQHIIEVTANDAVHAKAKDYLAVLPVPADLNQADAEGFVALFNNYDLTGWFGDTRGYVVEDGVMVCKPGGNLYTEKEFSDFIFRFEFKLTPGANNGLGIRAPGTGDAAYAGMELQIIDNTADMYKNLRPYQYHGSVYGIVPAKREYLKPVGEWNAEEVRASGRRITVILNGEIIVDADLDDALAHGAMDGHEHPGAKRDRGHIGFLGHGSRVEFRDMRIKEIKSGA